MNLRSPTFATYVPVFLKANTFSKTTCRNIRLQSARKCSVTFAVLGEDREFFICLVVLIHMSKNRLKHEDSLRKHLKRHQDTFANCPICNKVLQNKHSLGNHIRSVHGERSHQCTMCDKAFKKAIVLKVNFFWHCDMKVK